MTFEGQVKAAFIMYATGGGGGGAKRIFFSAALFFISPPPKVHTNFHNPPQAISKKINTPPLPSQEMSK